MFTCFEAEEHLAAVVVVGVESYGTLVRPGIVCCHFLDRQHTVGSCLVVTYSYATWRLRRIYVRSLLPAVQYYWSRFLVIIPVC